MSERIVVTGGASGLGRAIALRWAREGARVCVADIHEARGRATVDDIDAAGGIGLYRACDVTQESALRETAAYLFTKWGGVDVLVNNAGVAAAGSLDSESIEQWRWLLDVNLLGVVRGCQAFHPLFATQGNGHIVNVASQAGLTPAPRMGSYNAAKAAVIAYSETLRLELGDEGIGVSVLCPSFVDTNLHESLRTEEPEMKEMMIAFFARATRTADDVAEAVYRGRQKNRFMIQPHPEGRMAWRLKRFLPNAFYLWLMARITARLRKRRDDTQATG